MKSKEKKRKVISFVFVPACGSGVSDTDPYDGFGIIQDSGRGASYGFKPARSNL